MISEICDEIYKFFRKLEICINISYLLFIPCIILYYSYGIYILVNQYDMHVTIENNCNSKLWYYGILSIIGFSDKIMLRYVETLQSYSNKYYLLFLIELSFVIFGSIELFEKVCIYNHLSNYNELRIFCLINYVFQILTTSILILKIILMNKNRRLEPVDSFNNIENNSNVYNQDNVYIKNNTNVYTYSEDTENIYEVLSYNKIESNV